MVTVAVNVPAVAGMNLITKLEAPPGNWLFTGCVVTTNIDALAPLMTIPVLVKVPVSVLPAIGAGARLCKTNVFIKGETGVTGVDPKSVLSLPSGVISPETIETELPVTSISGSSHSIITEPFSAVAVFVFVISVPVLDSSKNDPPPPPWVPIKLSRSATPPPPPEYPPPPPPPPLFWLLAPPPPIPPSPEPDPP